MIVPKSNYFSVEIISVVICIEPINVSANLIQRSVSFLNRFEFFKFFVYYYKGEKKTKNEWQSKI